MASEYDDGLVACTDSALVIRRYDLFLRSKVVPYSRIRSAMVRELGIAFGKWRIWGSGDFRHWYNLDRGRPQKQVGIALDLGKWIKPVITPDDPDKVVALLRAQGVEVSGAARA